jgi:hypothetical protein
MGVFLYLIILITIEYISSQDYCDIEKNCSECSFCGVDTDDYCSCDFYNGFCLNNDSTQYFDDNFLLNYDGCLNKSQESNICGDSSISITDGKTTIIDFDSTDKEKFLCYYYFTGSTKDNQFTFTINSQGEQEFDIYFIIYQQGNSPTVTRISSSIFNNKIELIKSNVEKGSIYFDVGKGENLNQVSINILYEKKEENKEEKKEDDPTTTVKTSKSSNSSSNIGLIVGIIIGIVALIVIIIVGICVYFHYKKKAKLRASSTSNTNNNTNQNINNISNSNYDMNPQLLSAINSNKQKLEQLFNTELTPTIYQKNKVTNDSYNCTICMENFIENKSVIVTTKCNHSFHQKCFKNWAYKNIICPKCPNCNNLILGPQDSAFQNITIPSSMDYTIQTMQTNQNTTTQ